MRLMSVAALILNGLELIFVTPLLVREVPRADPTALVGGVIAATAALSGIAVAARLRGPGRATAITRVAAVLNAIFLVIAGVMFGGLAAQTVQPTPASLLLASLFTVTVAVNLWLLVRADGTGRAGSAAPSGRDRLVWNIYWACAGIALSGFVMAMLTGGRGALWVAIVALPVLIAGTSLVVFTGTFVRMYEDAAARRTWLRRRWLALITIGGYDAGTFRVNGIAGIAFAAGLAVWIGR